MKINLKSIISLIITIALTFSFGFVVVKMIDDLKGCKYLQELDKINWIY